MTKLTMVELTADEKKALQKVKRLRNVSDCAKVTGISRPTLIAINKRGAALNYHLELLRPYLNQTT